MSTFIGLGYSEYRDTAGQERFHTITTSYYRGAMVRFIRDPVVYVKLN